MAGDLVARARARLERPPTLLPPILPPLRLLARMARLLGYVSAQHYARGIEVEASRTLGRVWTLEDRLVDSVAVALRAGVAEELVEATVARATAEGKVMTWEQLQEDLAVHRRAMAEALGCELAFVDAAIVRFALAQVEGSSDGA